MQKKILYIALKILIICLCPLWYNFLCNQLSWHITYMIADCKTSTEYNTVKGETYGI